MAATSWFAGFAKEFSGCAPLDQIVRARRGRGRRWIREWSSRVDGSVNALSDGGDGIECGPGIYESSLGSLCRRGVSLVRSHAAIFSRQRSCHRQSGAARVLLYQTQAARSAAILVAVVRRFAMLTRT